MVEEKLHFFKLNVNHSVSVRFYRGDKDGRVLNPSDSIVEVEAKDLKAFREVNKGAFNQGLIKEIDEPATSWETPNALTDEDIAGLLSNYLKLKNSLESIDSLPILYKIREAAAEKGSSKKTISLISARIDAVEPEEVPEVTRGEMVSSYDEGVVARR